jgi:integrase
MSHRFRQAAADYLAIRRGLGFKLQGYDRLLADFLGYLERSGASAITVQAAVAWATAPAGASAGRWSDRLCAVRGLARHLQGIDSSVEVPPLELIACRRQRRIPYQYSPSDIARLVEAAASLRPALRGATYEALFGLLSCTGMRVGETIALNRGDVDLCAGELEITDAKFRKHRRLPLHGSTVAALRRYAEVRDRLCPRPKVPSFFVSTRGTRLLYVCVNEVFRKLIEDIGLAAQRVLAIPGKRHDRHDVSFLRPEEVDALLAAPDRSTWIGRRDHALLVLAVQTGLRVSELTGLGSHDLQLGSGPHVRCTGKGRKDRATPLTAHTVAVLREWMKERAAWSADPLFVTSRGGPLSTDAVQWLVAKYAITAAKQCPSIAAKTVSPHALRHTCAMNLLHSGVDVAVIALWLGHESSQTTSAIYLHADMSLKEQALARTTPPNTRPGRYRPRDALLAFLEGL